MGEFEEEGARVMDSEDRLKLQAAEKRQPEATGKKLKDLTDRELAEATIMSVQQCRREVAEAKLLLVQVAQLLESAMEYEEEEKRAPVIVTPRGHA